MCQHYELCGPMGILLLFQDGDDPYSAPGERVSRDGSFPTLLTRTPSSFTRNEAFYGLSPTVDLHMQTLRKVIDGEKNQQITLIVGDFLTRHHQALASLTVTK